MPLFSQTVRFSSWTTRGANFLNIIAAKEAAKNKIPTLANKWPYINIYCLNKKSIY